MNFTSLEQRRLLERPRELALHRRDLSEAAEVDEGGGERGGRADEHMILASAARFKENGADTDRLYHADGEVLPDREPPRTLKRRLDGAVPPLDRFERGSERASTAPPSDPRRRVGAGGFERGSDRPERGSTMDPRRLEGSSTLTFDRPLARPERSLSAAGRERDDERERTRAADDNPGLEQHKEKDLSAEAIQEIVAQYKAALTELTVNSKIIITKLTIFAGDNIHAAKGIAATICAHILEAPSDQKLPSLYLLDSIVKNIGRDFVELFAARLPEVFCEAYKQVDPSLHPKMKRLFETWREVFFGDPLLVIEAQLQFGVSSNVLPASKPAQSPPQRPGHGIHVNPSYLEAQRQRLQQSSRPPTAETPKDGFNAEIGAKKGYTDNFLDYDYVCTDIGSKVGNEMPRTQEAWGKAWPKEDGSLLRPTDSELDQPRYPKGNVLDGRHPTSRLLIDAYGNIRVPPVLKSPPVMVPPQRDRSKGGGSIQKNWEEEGHSWEDKNTRPVDNDRQWEASRKDAWFLGEGGKDLPDVGAVDRVDVRNNRATHDRAAWHQDAPLSLLDRTNPTFQREQEESGIGALSSSEREISGFGLNPGSIQGHQFPADRLHHTSPQHASSMMQLNLRPFPYMQPNQLPPLQLPPLPGSLSSSALPGNGSSFGFSPVLPRPMINPQNLVPPQVGASLPSPQSMSVFPTSTLGHGNISATNQAQLSEQHVSMHPSLPHPVVQLPLPQPSPSFQASDTQSLQAGNPSLELPSLFERSSGALPVLPTELLQSLKQLQEHLPGLKSMPDKHVLVLQSEQLGVMQQQQQQQQQQWNQQVLPPVADPRQTLNADGAQTGVQNHNPGHLLAAFFGSVAVSSSESAQLVPEKSFAAPLFRDSAHFSITPMSTGQPQALYPAAQGNFPPVAASAHAAHPGQVLQPPLPPGPPPLSSQVASLPVQPLTNITSLLSSLVAQGVISAANSATPSSQPHIGPTSLLASNQHMDASHVAAQVPTDDSSSMTMASTFSSQGLTSIAADAPSIVGPLGFEFKTELLRERHDFVVNALYSNLLHQCKTCGLRCKSQDDLMKHMERHAPKINVQNLSAKLSRHWFANKEEWVKGVDSSVPHLPAIPEYLVDQSFPKVEDNEEPAVPADEDQAACMLCGEPFEDFYDDETDLWMYKGAVYLNTVPGMASKDKGPIVHAKCRSTSDVPDMDIMEAGLELEQAKKRL